MVRAKGGAIKAALDASKNDEEARVRTRPAALALSIVPIPPAYWPARFDPSLLGSLSVWCVCVSPSVEKVSAANHFARGHVRLSLCLALGLHGHRRPGAEHARNASTAVIMTSPSRVLSSGEHTGNSRFDIAGDRPERWRRWCRTQRRPEERGSIPVQREEGRRNQRLHDEGW